MGRDSTERPKRQQFGQPRTVGTTSDASESTPGQQAGFRSGVRRLLTPKGTVTIGQSGTGAHGTRPTLTGASAQLMGDRS